ncbi:MAG TPA: serine/threonine-protein kinase [Labilithrix sp.]
MAGSAFGKYRLLAELGHGGMADVFLAVQAGPIGSGFKKLMVVKRLRQNLADEPEFVAMLVDEARIAARLNHPNVVQTNEVGDVDGQYFIAMEYLDGQPMHRLQHRSGTRVKEGKGTPLTMENQLVVVMDALAGLHHAHELMDYDGTPLQIVHRDMTPHNIFVTYDGQTKVVDFGIAKAAGRMSETRQGVVKGKVRYMAPEQAIGLAVDRRADVFSMGVILWEVLAGRRLWKDMDDMQIVQALIAGSIPGSPKTFDPTVPDALDKIAQRALGAKADDRYASAEDFRSDLEQALADSGKLLEARRKLAPAVVELFADKRSEIKSIIEKQLSDLDQVMSGEFRAVQFPGSGDSSNSLSASNVAVTVEEAPTMLADPKTSMYAGAPPAARPRRAAMLAAAAALVGIGVSVAAWRVLPANAGASAAAVDHSAPISLHLSGSPANAQVSIDDGPPQPLPLDKQVGRDERDHKLTVVADGFAPRTESVRFTRDLAMMFDLTPVAAAAASVEPRKPPTVVTVWQAAPPPKKSSAPAPPAPPTVAAATQTATAPAPTPSQPEGRKPPMQLDKGDPWANK